MSLIEYQGIIVTYGYLAIMLGTFLEGEMILVLGGFLAHQGYLSLPGVIIAAFVGSMLTDQMFFLLGRFRGRPFLRKRPALLNRIARADNLLTRHRVPVTLGFRFLYGMRTVIPFALGLSSIRLALFVPLNAIGALIWASAGGSLGFVFGR
ncbi:DedA family protein, partial [Desulfocurvibacter africanus]